MPRANSCTDHWLTRMEVVNEMPRATELNLLYEGKPAKIGTIEQFEYVDEAEGKSDSVSITVDDIDSRWNNGWTPTHYDKIAPAIIIYRDDSDSITLQCGEFIVDDYSLSAPPLTCEINAISTPLNYGFKALPKSKIWKKVTIKRIAEEISKENKLSLVFDAEDSNVIKEKEQSFESDCSFLSKLCSDYGKKYKVYSSKIVIYDVERYEDKDIVAEIKPYQCSSWSFNTCIHGTYTGAIFSYTDPKSDKTYKVKVGTDDRILYMNESAENKEDARAKALAKINESNRSMYSMEIKLKHPFPYFATQNVQITDFGQFVDGKYFINTVKHSISSGGYVVNLSLRRLVPRITK